MKPTQEQILRALNKLVRENKTELKAEKIELGLIDDIEKLFMDTKEVTKQNITLWIQKRNLLEFCKKSKEFKLRL